MKVTTSLFTLIFFVISIFWIRPSTQKSVDPVLYFYKYGYLTSLDYVDEDIMEKATRKYQKSFGLPQTGRLDQDTKTKMALPRCGMPEKARTTVRQDSEYTWKTRFLTYKIRNCTQFFPESQIKQVMEKAIQLWTQNTELKITESSTNSTNINVYFSVIDEEDALGYAYPPETGDIYLADIEDLSLEPTASWQVSAAWLVAHELGHALGLDHASSGASVMYPAYDAAHSTLEPSMVDRNNLVALYGGRAGLDAAPLCGGGLHVDAALSVDGSRIAVRGDLCWTLAEGGLAGGPFSLNELFPFEDGVPGTVSAAFDDGTVSFLFVGRHYYKFKARRLVRRRPISVGFAGLPAPVDAAFYESGRKAVHFFRGSKYYMFSNKKLVIRDANISDYWNGVPNDPEAATMIEEEKVLFVKGNKCYFVDINSNKVVQIRDCAKDFFKCN